MDWAAFFNTMGPGWRLYFGFIVFAFGACLGSFLNVCIYRIPRGLSVVTPRSHCPNCNQPIAGYDNIPLVSYLVLRARCRHCGVRIVPRYFLVELLVGVLFLLVWFKYGLPGTGRLLALSPVTDLRLVWIYWLVVFGLVLGTFVDFEHMIIPDRVSLGGLALGLVLSALVPSLHGQPTLTGGLVRGLLGAALGSGSLWLMAVLGKLAFKKDAMGLGDVKLLGAIGAFFGWFGVLFTLILSSFTGSAVGLTLVASGKTEMQGRIPYGPYLALGALVWMLWGHTLLALYLNWMWPPV